VFFGIKTSITKYQGLITPYPRPPGVPHEIKGKKKKKLKKTLLGFDPGSPVP
jgi:hypothetical protein